MRALTCGRADCHKGGKKLLDKHFGQFCCCSLLEYDRKSRDANSPGFGLEMVMLVK
jgi:hypothetical protein